MAPNFYNPRPDSLASRLLRRIPPAAAMAAVAAAIPLLLVLISVMNYHAHASDSDPLSSNPLLTGKRQYSPGMRSLVQNRYMLAENSTRKNGTTTNPTAASPEAAAAARKNGTTTAASPEAAAAARKNGTTTAASPAPSPEAAAAAHHHRKRHKVKNLVVGFVTGTIAGIATGVVLSLLFRMLTNCIRGRYRGPGGPSIFSPQIIKRREDLAFLEKEGGLASLEIIGRGGCGEVYRAQLPGNPGRTVAVKKIRRVSPDQLGSELAEEDSRVLDKKMRQIRSEIRTVGHIRHRNLLSLLAHVPRPDCHYLVYDFMKNGSLHDFFVQERELDWLARHKIAMGIAAGLEYLHHSHKPRIIHRDLKPANILIDDGMEARIADFGLAKEMPDANTHMTTSNVAGTVGYIAPEYYQMLKFTAKCDVYSLGVILGVLVTGRMPSDEFFQETEETSMVKWLRNVIGSANPKEAIDPRMIGNGYEEQMLLVARIACFCTAEDPKERPNSKNVGAMLSQIKH